MTYSEFDTSMCAQFPQIFKMRNESCMVTCMCWGFEIGPGWHKMLIDACTKIKAICDETGLEVYADQIKEKFGTLRFYCTTVGDNLKPEYRDDYSQLDKQIHDIIYEAESKSETTCESCGAIGYTGYSGWVTTLCESCRTKKD